MSSRVETKSVVGMDPSNDLDLNKIDFLRRRGIISEEKYFDLLKRKSARLEEEYNEDSVYGAAKGSKIQRGDGGSSTYSASPTTSPVVPMDVLSSSPATTSMNNVSLKVVVGGQQHSIPTLNIRKATALANNNISNNVSAGGDNVVGGRTASSSGVNSASESPSISERLDVNNNGAGTSPNLLSTLEQTPRSQLARLEAMIKELRQQSGGNELFSPRFREAKQKERQLLEKEYELLAYQHQKALSRVKECEQTIAMLEDLLKQFQPNIIVSGSIHPLETTTKKQIAPGVDKALPITVGEGTNCNYVNDTMVASLSLNSKGLGVESISTKNFNNSENQNLILELKKDIEDMKTYQDKLMKGFEVILTEKDAIIGKFQENDAFTVTDDIGLDKFILGADVLLSELKTENYQLKAKLEAIKLDRDLPQTIRSKHFQL